MKISADTNFLISATQWDYSVSHKLLTKLIENNAEIFTTKEILDEFSEVLSRDFKYTAEEIKNIVDNVFVFITITEPNEKINVITEDPDDNKILECAVSSESEYILTYDDHLLKIKEFRGIEIITPEKLIEII
ncbi:putative toxin-antitoxin system toxin component, PIN family [Candidatus Pacearchaeota archaeon]|nr:putative toxin-antitoxin system toxin component, PIN family [Candidatus Pacearchaeota archaeon]